jgi:hypothetical protein
MAERCRPRRSVLVELQALITPRPMFTLRPGIEVIAPVLADSWVEARAATAFLRQSPLRPKASYTLPLLPVSLDRMQKAAGRSHFPAGMRWCVDNMRTNASIDDLLPGIHALSADMRPAPSHVLWLDWRPPASRTDMVFSLKANRYLALYGEWRDPAQDAQHSDWARRHIAAMANLGVGSQLADENLRQRPSAVMRPEDAQRLEMLRQRHDPQSMIGGWPILPSGLAKG